MEQKAQIALASKKQDLLYDQLREIKNLELLKEQYSSYSLTKEAVFKSLKAKLATLKFMKNNSVRDEDLVDFLKYEWPRVRKTLLKQWIEQEDAKRKLCVAKTFEGTLEENYNSLLEALELGIDGETFYDFETVKNYQYILIPQFFKTIDKVTLNPEDHSYLDPINEAHRKMKDSDFSKKVPPNLFKDDIFLNDTQKAKIKELLSKQERRQDVIAFIVMEIVPYQSTNSVAADNDMLQKLFEAKCIPNRHKGMLQQFKEMNCRQQIRALLAQWTCLETVIYTERGLTVNTIARQARFIEIFQPIIGMDARNYNLESLVLEDALHASYENVKIAKNTECFQSVANYNVRGMENVFIFNDEHDFVSVENSRTTNLDHAKKLGLIDTPRPSSRFQESYVKPFRRAMFNLGCKVS